jgi:serine/threonine-protein kinase
VLTALAVFELTRRRKLSAEATIWIGLLFQVVAAAGIDAFLIWVPITRQTNIMGLSWVTVWIMCFGLVIRANPTQTLIGALGAASMTPLMLGIAVARGISDPSPEVIFMLCFPNYVCVVISVLSARIVYGMRKQVSEARAMGSYRLVEKLGQGGMGEVWRAQHQRLVRPAAIKLIRPSVLTGKNGAGASTAFQRFEREAQVTATLESANTVRLYDYGLSDDGSFYYVMELLRGLDLERLVARFGALPPARAVYLLRQACHSLAEAHSKGLIHRDIKPANIYTCLIGQDFDFAKVLDFGLVKPLVTAGEDLALTQVGVTTGTPAYLAPEMALGKAEVDCRADIYSLGCVGYWLLTGKLLFQASSAFEMAMHHVQKQPLSPSEISETEIPPELNRIVLACLEKDPAKRPQSMTELSNHLAGVPLTPWTQQDARDWWLVNLPALSS